MPGKIRASPNVRGFLLPGASGLEFRVCQYADDATAFVKDERSLHALFNIIADFERGSGAKLNRAKTEALWLGAWKDRPDEPLGLSWVKKTKILGIVFGSVNVECDNWEPRLSKLDQCVSRWKNRSLSFIGKVLILNILGLSKLLFVSSILAPPRWVDDRINRIIWPFLWGSRIETVARKSLICPETDGGLGLRAPNLPQFRAVGLSYVIMRRPVRFHHPNFTLHYYKAFENCVFPLIFPTPPKSFTQFYWRKSFPYLSYLPFGLLLFPAFFHCQLIGRECGITLPIIVRMTSRG